MNKIHVMVTVREEKPKEPEYHFCYQCKQFYRHYVQSDYTFMGYQPLDCGHCYPPKKYSRFQYHKATDRACCYFIDKATC